MNTILFDGSYRNQFLPLTYMRPMADLRVGILTLREKWEKYLGSSATTLTQEYLSAKYPVFLSDDNLFIQAAFLPHEFIAQQVADLNLNQKLVYHGEVLAYRVVYNTNDLDALETIEYNGECDLLKNSWDLFLLNDKAIVHDFELLTKDKTSLPIPEHCTAFNASAIFIEEGAEVLCSVLNATNGPIYIGKDATVMESCNLRGPIALCEHATIKMGAKIYGATTIGPHCKVGGEVNNSILFAYSNKGHDGFLGNSVLAEWCNLGADTNNSNLKNDYSEVKLWDYTQERFVKTGQQFCGLIMGDHSKSAINTMFNTGTVVGISSTIFGSGFVKNFIPSFSWGGDGNSKTYLLNRAIETANRMMERRGMAMNQEDSAIMEYVFEQSKKWRRD